MLPLAILTAVTGLLTAIAKLISAGQDKAAQETALMEAAESLKAAMDHVKFGDTMPAPEAPVTEPEPQP
jgi:type II secretory pathway pseudopilin PulG